MSLKVYLSTSERSGFVYARLLSRELKRMDPDVEIYGLTESAAVKAGSQELAPVGFVQGARASGNVLDRVKDIEREVRLINPDLFLAVAWSEPNIVLGMRLRDMKGMRRVFFAPPQLWAWGRWRTSLLKKGYHLLLALYPREALFLKSLGLNAVYAGNPLKGFIEPYFLQRREKGYNSQKIALLPGTRDNEKSTNLRLLREFVKEWRKINPGYTFSWLFLTAGEAEAERAFMGEGEVAVAGDARFRELASARLALVTSGTASLETALAGVPQIVFYCMPGLELALARVLTRVRCFALPNLVMGRNVVIERINPKKPDLVALSQQMLSEERSGCGLGELIHSELTPLTNGSLSLELLLIDNRIGRIRTKEA